MEHFLIFCWIYLMHPSDTEAKKVGKGRPFRKKTWSTLATWLVKPSVHHIQSWPVRFIIKIKTKIIKKSLQWHSLFFFKLKNTIQFCDNHLISISSARSRFFFLFFFTFWRAACGARFLLIVTTESAMPRLLFKYSTAKCTTLYVKPHTSYTNAIIKHKCDATGQNQTRLHPTFWVCMAQRRLT